jgi:anion-transporting  ArsA/GET3 family ATPase
MAASRPGTDQLPELCASQLEAFETPIYERPLKPLTWSIEKYEVAQQLALSRKTITQISEDTMVPLSAINRWRAHPDFRAYMDKLVLDTAETLKARRLQLLSKVLDARVERAEELGDYASLTSKDTLDVLEAIRKETVDDQPKESSKYLKTLEALLVKTARREREIELNPSAPAAQEA